MRYPEFKNEKLILPIGHTMSFISIGDEIFAYVGHVKFDGIDLYCGKSLYDLKPAGRILSSRRWGIVRKQNCGSVIMFCARSMNRKDIYRDQKIMMYSSPNGIDFNMELEITDGSAPWICVDGETNYLFFHRNTGLEHQILFRKSNSIYELGAAVDNVLISSPIWKTLSAPSIININRKYYMLLEYQEIRKKSRSPWRTLLYSSDSIDGEYAPVGVLLTNDRACAFQYMIDGKLHILFSKRTGPGCGDWGIFDLESST
jgi:hypothetical protein